MSKLLSKILNSAILPASMMIVSKLFGVLLAANFGKMQLFINDDVDHFFPVQIVVLDSFQASYINSFSNLFLLLIMTSSFLYLFSRYFIYKNVNENPRTIAKIAKFNLLTWITSKNVHFIKVFVWGVFLISTGSIIVTSTLQAKTYSWVGISAFMIAILTIWGLIRSFEQEVNKVYPKAEENLF